MSGSREKLRAVFLAAVMVLSVVAMSGTAAAGLQTSVSDFNSNDVSFSQQNPNAGQVNEVTFKVKSDGDSGDAALDSNGLGHVAIDISSLEGDFDLSSNKDSTVVSLGGSTVDTSNYGVEYVGSGSDADVAWGSDTDNSFSSTQLLVVDFTSGQSVPSGENISVTLEGVTNPSPSSDSTFDATVSVADTNADGSSDDGNVATNSNSNAISITGTSNLNQPSVSAAGSPTDVEVDNGGTTQDVTGVDVNMNDYAFHFANAIGAPTYDASNDQVNVNLDASNFDGLSNVQTNFDTSTSSSVSITPGSNSQDASDVAQSSGNVIGFGLAPTDNGFSASQSASSVTADVTLSGIDTTEQSTQTGLSHSINVDAYQTGSSNSPSASTSGTATNTFDLIAPQASTLPGDGSANGDVTTSIQTSGSDKQFQAIEAGSAAQSLGLIKVRDNSGGDSPLSARTLIDAQSGVTFNATASENLLVTATSGDLSVTNFEIVNNGDRLRIEHSGSSEDGQTVRISGLHVDVANDVSASSSGTRNAFTVDTATTNFDTELLNAYTPSISLGGTTNIGAGESSKDVSNNIDLSVASPTNGDISGIIANQSDIVIFANQSNGITFDTSVDPSSLSFSGTTSKVNTSGVSISGDQLTIPVTSDFSGGDSLQITSGLKVNASEQASDSLLSAETTATSSTGAVAAEQTSTGNNINVQKPQVTYAGGSDTLAVGEEGASVSNVVVDSITAGDLTTGSDSDDATGFINITTNRSGVTFDKSADYSGNNLVSSTSNNLVDAGDDGTTSTPDFTNDVVVTDDKLAVNVELNGPAGSSDAITLSGIQVNVSDTEPEGGNVNFNARTTPANNKQIPVNATVDGSPSSDPAPATFDKPDLQEASDSISIGSTGQTVSSTPLKVTSTIDGDLTTGSDSDDSTGFVNVTINRSDVTFDKSADYSGNNVISSTSGNLVDAGDQGTTSTPNFDNDISVTDDKLSVEVELNGGPSGAAITFGGGIPLNTSSDITDGEKAVLNVTTTPEAGKTVTKGATSNTITLTKGSASLSGDQTVSLDNNGQTGVSLNALTVNSQTQGDLTTGSDSGGDTGFVNVTLNGSGVTFDTSQDTTGNNLVGSTSGNIQDASQDANSGSDGDFTDDVIVTEDKLAVNIALDGGTSSSDALTIDGALLNVSQDVADNSTFGLTVTTTPDTNTESTSDVSETITVQTVNPDGISTSPGTTSPTTADGSDTTVTVTSSSLSSTDTSTNFGEAEVDLSILSQPDGADKSIGDVVNQTTLTTANDGTATYNFSTDTAGSYTIDHNASGQVNTTVTYDVSSGDIAEVDVSGTENALSGGASNLDDNLQTGVYRVNVTDPSGNLANTDEDFQFRVLTGGDTSAFIGLSNELTSDGQGTSAGTSVTPGFGGTTGPFTDAGTDNNVIEYNPSNDGTEKGSFYVYVGNDLSEDIDVQIIPRSGFSDINSDTGTATFFSSVDSTQLEAPDTVNADENVNVTATGTTSSGETVAVPRLSQSFSSDNTSALDVVSSSGTDTAGEATANISGVAEGSANLTASIQSQDTSQEITVGEPATASGSVTFDNQTVSNGTEEVNVANANYTLADGTAGDYVVVAHVVNDDGSISDPVGYSSNVTGDTDGITVDLNASEAQGDALDTLTANTTLRAMLHETSSDSAFGPSLGLATDDANITVQEAAPEPADFTVSNVTPDGVNVTAGDNITVSADIENVGGQQATQSVEFRIVAADGNTSIDNASATATQNVTLDAGANDTVTFENVSTDGLATGDFTHGVFSANDSATATITLQDQGLVARFDENDNGEIELTEVQTAIRAFSNDDLTLTEIQTLIREFSGE